jgi:hypothetical protein
VGVKKMIVCSSLVEGIAMPMRVPSLDDVESWVRELAGEVTRCTGKMDRKAFERLRVSVLHHDWVLISDTEAEWSPFGIRRLIIDQSIFLVRALMEIVVDKHRNGVQGREIKEQIRSFLEPLAELKHSEATLDFVFERSVRAGPLAHIVCTIEGIVVSATPTGK